MKGSNALSLNEPVWKYLTVVYVIMILGPRCYLVIARSGDLKGYGSYNYIHSLILASYTHTPKYSIVFLSLTTGNKVTRDGQWIPYTRIGVLYRFHK